MSRANELSRNENSARTIEGLHFKQPRMIYLPFDLATTLELDADSQSSIFIAPLSADLFNKSLHHEVTFGIGHETRFSSGPGLRKAAIHPAWIRWEVAEDKNPNPKSPRRR